MTRKALGRGLSSLIPVSPAQIPPIEDSIYPNEGKFTTVPINKIRPNHLQPRRHFEPESLTELAASIKQHGLAQPVLVSYDSTNHSYELIAGERRWRAAALAGLKEMDVFIRQPRDEKHRMALTLIENLQRADLNPIEIAIGYLRLMKEFEINQTALSEYMGKSKAAISNTLRLLDLSDEIQKALQFGHISEGHGRALLTIADPNLRHSVFQKLSVNKLSVRETETLAREIEGKEVITTKSVNKNKVNVKSADIASIEESLQHILGTKVVIRTKKNASKGSISISFFSFEDFDRILKIIKK